MYLRVWEGKEYLGLFPCQEVDSMRPKTVRNVVIVVTELAIVQVQSVQGKPFAYVVAAATLTSIDSCSYTHLHPNIVTFRWRSGLTQVFKFTEATSCLDLLSANLFHAGIQKKKHTINPLPTLSQKDVNIDSVEHIQIDVVLAKIKEVEENLAKEVRFDTIEALMPLIQQAIEYFSAINDPRHEVFLEKLHDVLKSDRVQSLLIEVDEQLPSHGKEASLDIR